MLANLEVREIFNCVADFFIYRQYNKTPKLVKVWCFGFPLIFVDSFGELGYTK